MNTPWETFYSFFIQIIKGWQTQFMKVLNLILRKLLLDILRKFIINNYFEFLSCTELNNEGLKMGWKTVM